jgi:hypothetical protein
MESGTATQQSRLAYCPSLTAQLTLDQTAARVLRAIRRKHRQSLTLAALSRRMLTRRRCRRAGSFRKLSNEDPPPRQTPDCSPTIRSGEVVDESFDMVESGHQHGVG